MSRSLRRVRNAATKRAYPRQVVTGCVADRSSSADIRRHLTVRKRADGALRRIGAVSRLVCGPYGLAALLLVLLAGCASQAHPILASTRSRPQPRKPTPPAAPAIVATAPAGAPYPGQRVIRLGDEIMVCGQLFHTGAPVILWLDPDGYDAYRVERRFVPPEDSSWVATTQATKIKTPNRYGTREDLLTPKEQERVRQHGWDLSLLQEKVDQFVLHYDVAGYSRGCFAALHDDRGLSVHFMLDLDGTIYQTLDLKDRAWHATISNSRSIGIEIANVGAYQMDEPDPFKQWYTRDATGKLRITLPPRAGDGGIRTADFVGRPARDAQIVGTIQGHKRRQYDFTPQQYDSLIKLTAALCAVFPKMACDYPKDAEGKLIPQKLSDEQLANFHGILGHYHIQAEKVDPGPAMQWDKVINGARAMLKNVPDTQPATQPTDTSREEFRYEER